MFFTAYHDALVATLRDLLSEDGEVIIAAPERGSTMKQFLEKAGKVFKVEIDYCEDFLKLSGSLSMGDLTPRLIKLTHLV